MAKIPYAKKPRALVGSAILVALLGSGSAAQQYLEITSNYEGYVPVGYRDPVGIPTKCFGDTTNVIVGKKYSFEECERSLNNHSVEIIRPVRKCIKGFDRLHDDIKVSIASMAYNIGPGAMCSSTVVKYLNAKNYRRACTRMAEIYKYATDRRTGKKVELKGLGIRRKGESELCLRGVNAQSQKAKQSQGAYTYTIPDVAFSEFQAIAWCELPQRGPATAMVDMAFSSF